MPRPIAYDFLVVGAGSAGCEVARSLADQFSVAIIEAGGGDCNLSLRRPADYLTHFSHPDHPSPNDWGFHSAPQTQLANRSLPMPRGKGLGGSTRINASIWLEPDPLTLADLHRDGGDFWSPQRLQKSIEEVRRITSPEPPRWLSLAALSFIETAQLAGYQPIVHPRMNRQGVRRLASDLLDPRKVTIFTNFLVDRVAWRDHRAIGVWGWPQNHASESLSASNSQLITAKKGVILSAGAILSPVLLWRSGIGPRQALQKLGVPIVYENDAVGENLQDHLAIPFVFPVRCTSASRPVEWFSNSWSPRDLARWQATGGGPVASNLAECGILSPRLHESDRQNAFQLHCTPTDYLRYPRPGGAPALSIAVNGSWPNSRGRVRLDSPQPGAPPTIDPNFLHANDDWAAILHGAKTVAQIIQCPPMQAMIEENRLLRGGDVDTNRLVRHVERFALTLYHPCGTCLVSDSNSGVVNQNLKVHGSDNLWVVDASILPRIPGCNPNPMIMGVANRWASQWLE